MSNGKKKTIKSKAIDLDFDEIFQDVPMSPVSSGETSKAVPVPNEIASAGGGMPALGKADPLFRLLAEPTLPSLPKRDRATLQMQSPHRIHFYWSVKRNPFETLDKALGGRIGSYSLVARLRNLSRGTERLLQVDSRGDYWFDVDSDTLYQAELGFYAPNRPYIRIAFSNKLRTPRKQPSNRTDYTPSFAATAGEFAKALDAAGYKKDAFDVALTGDNRDAAWKATMEAYLELTGKRLQRQSEAFENDLRFALMALAAGYSIEEIGRLIDPFLFELIKSDLSAVAADKALAALEDRFDVVTDDFEEFEEFAPAVFGASVVNFPKRLKRRRVPKSLIPKLEDFETDRSITSYGGR